MDCIVHRVTKSRTQLNKWLIWDLIAGMLASLIAPLVKNLPAMQETLVQFLGWEDPLEKG